MASPPLAPGSLKRSAPVVRTAWLRRAPSAIAAGAGAAVAGLALLVRSAPEGAAGWSIAGALLLGVGLAAGGYVAGARRPGLSADGALTGAAAAEAVRDQSWILRERLDQLSELAEETGDLVIRRDQSGRVVYVNQAVCRVLKSERTSLLGMRFRDLSARLAGQPPGDAAEEPPLVLPRGEAGGTFWTALRRRLGGGTGEDAAEGTADDGPIGIHGDIAIQAEGASRWYSFTERAMHRDGALRGWQTVGRDITERKAIEEALSVARDQAEAASAAKSRFLAMVSHEIRTPLNGILGMTGLLLQTQLSAEQRTYARAVETSGEALLLLIEDLLDFSKIEAGRLDLAIQPMPLAETIEELVELMAPRASAKGIELAAYIDPRLPATVQADPVRLKQVLFNLAGNGIKFTAEGGVAVEVLDATTGSEPPGVRTALFQIRDTGIGIGAHDRERIFGEFEQADPGPARSFGGTGLGLAIARRLVQLMGGDIAVDSAPGAGACFSFRIPLPTADPAARTDGAVAGSGAGGDEPSAAVEAGAGAAHGARAAQELLFASFGQRPAPAVRDQDAQALPTPLSGRRVLLVSHALIEGPLVVRRLFEAGADVVLATQRDLEGALIKPDPVDAILVDAAADDPVRTVERIRAITETPVGIIIDPRQRPLLPDLQAAGYGSYLVKPVRSRSLLVAVRTLIGEAGFDGLAADAAEPEQTVGPVTERCLNVLLCDDNEINLLLGRGLVEKLGSRVVTAADGRRAVAAVEESLRSGDTFDLILMDLHMPEMDGVEAARRIRTLAEELAPGRPAPRILALTADVMSATRERCEAGLFDAWLGKPLLPAQLRAAFDGIGRDTD